MVYYLSQYLWKLAQNTGWEDPLSFLRLFKYITVRSAGAAITALALGWWLGPKVIAWLKRARFGQQYADKAEETGFLTRSGLKRGTPTMGGMLIVMIMDATALLWAQWNTLMQLTLLSVLVLAGLGFYDDWAKITQQNNRGTPPNVKLWVQFALATFIALYLWKSPAVNKLKVVSEVMAPFVKTPVAVGAAGIVIGLILTVLTIVGSSNAVNLTDGLDGLAIGCTLIVSFVFVVLTYIAGNERMASYLQVPYVPGAGELTVFCAAMIGAGLGFLWYNCHPAQVFMGDTGSLALGGALGIIAVLIRQPLVLVIAGGVFVLEAASVLLQTSYFKYTKRRTGTGQRIFLMAPLHHHFEKKGWHESQVVLRFYILGILCAVVALCTLKIR
ncbi:MAG: phospho-N-acetylmuramoyl-pentapeptide-transferase [Verrucomicrobia subdivision 3 bacterium]|nr:phospho-N-acetylmuramoyl-pentapeptide-transferase [Limisphaerales bacterium]